jgi:nitrite reductase/ring-hydroxylating ferredoxin subunit
MACHEDDIPNVGDSHVYDIAHLSYVIVRTGPDEIRAFPNACLHRGRALLTEDSKGLHEFRCPFHGWGWKIDGTLKEVPCQWDFPSVSARTHSLPSVRVGRWGGWVFINPAVLFIPTWEFIKSMMVVPSFSGSVTHGKPASFLVKLIVATILIFTIVFIISGIYQAETGKTEV